MKEPTLGQIVDPLYVPWKRHLVSALCYGAGPQLVADRALDQLRQDADRFGVKLNPRAWWIGAHYSRYNKRLCINILPCVTLWWVQPGGLLP